MSSSKNKLKQIWSIQVDIFVARDIDVLINVFSSVQSVRDAIGVDTAVPIAEVI